MTKASLGGRWAGTTVGQERIYKQVQQNRCQFILFYANRKEHFTNFKKILMHLLTFLCLPCEMGVIILILQKVFREEVSWKEEAKLQIL